MNISVAVSAMINKAAGALMDSCPVDKVYTFHKMMGFTKDLLDDKLSLEDFTRDYCKVHRGAIFSFDAWRKLAGAPQKDYEISRCHSCCRPRPESCAACRKIFLAAVEKQAPKPPPFLGVNVLIVDEYGLMNAELLERMLCCLALFYGLGRGPLIVFSGSVSQLQPVGSNRRIWETARFESLLSSSTQLFVNRRQFQDPGYAEALTYLQFNTVTEESRRIFRSQVSVRESDIMNPV